MSRKLSFFGENNTKADLKKKIKNMESKEDVFYARCRPQVKQALYIQMQKDGFKSMSDWFDQFVTELFLKGTKRGKASHSNRR